MGSAVSQFAVRGFDPRRTRGDPTHRGQPKADSPGPGKRRTKHKPPKTANTNNPKTGKTRDPDQETCFKRAARACPGALVADSGRDKVGVLQ